MVQNKIMKLAAIVVGLFITLNNVAHAAVEINGQTIQDCTKIDEFADCQFSCALDCRYGRLDNVDFSGMDLSGSLFEHTDLTGVDFIFTRLHNADFKDVYFDNVNFNGAFLSNAKFKRGSWSNVNFDSADLESTQFIDCAFDGEVFFTNLRSMVDSDDFTGSSWYTAIWRLPSDYVPDDQLADVCANRFCDSGCHLGGCTSSTEHCAAIKTKWNEADGCASQVENCQDVCLTPESCNAT